MKQPLGPRKRETHVRETDEITGVETTGHEWDGIKELDNPMPRWWILTFYASIIWSIGYWVVYPTWPMLKDYTRGIAGYSQRATVAADLKQAELAQAGMRELMQRTALVDIRSNPELLRFATVGGGASFQTNCAPCHGRGAQGAAGYPNLNDDDWIWGGSVEDIYKTLQFGIRSEHKQTRASPMPRYGADNLLRPAQINDLAEYVLSLSGQAAEAIAAERGSVMFKEQCAACHGDDAKGKLDQGSVNLTDGIWLYGGSKQDIIESIRTGRGGMMPAWAGRLDDVTLKSLAIYVHSLGGGK
jgi:cytochrome c oxidase cbb3-type subunit III